MYHLLNTLAQKLIVIYQYVLNDATLIKSSVSINEAFDTINQGIQLDVRLTFVKESSQNIELFTIKHKKSNCGPNQGRIEPNYGLEANLIIWDYTSV